MAVKYPEHEKLRAVQDRSQAIHEFIVECLEPKGILLAPYPKGSRRLAPVMQRLTDLVADFLGIDQNKLELEKRAMLEQIRKAVPQ